MMNKTVFIALALITLTACSNKAVYNNIQLNQRNKCLKEPPALYDECVKRTEKSYEQYQREREEALKPRKQA